MEDGGWEVRTETCSTCRGDGTLYDRIGGSSAVCHICGGKGVTVARDTPFTLRDDDDETTSFQQEQLRQLEGLNLNIKLLREQVMNLVKAIELPTQVTLKEKE